MVPDRSLLRWGFWIKASLNGHGVASDLETTSRRRGGGFEKLAIFAAKLIVTGGAFGTSPGKSICSQSCLRYPCWIFVGRHLRSLVVVLQIPLLGVRWCNILDALAVRTARVTVVATIAVSAIGVFFAQVLPSVAGEGVRAWLLVRLGCDWRSAVTSVVIDRGVGVGPDRDRIWQFCCCCLRASRLSADTARWCWSFTAPAPCRSSRARAGPDGSLRGSLGGDFPVGSRLWPWTPVAYFLAPTARRFGHRMSRSCPYHRRHLVAGTRKACCSRSRMWRCCSRS